MGTGRQPLSDKHKAALEKLGATIGRFLDEEGLAGESAEAGTGMMPVEGGTGMMPVARGKAAAPLDPEQIAQIVTGVLSALRQRGVV